MEILKHLKRIKRIDELVRNEKTGTPEQLAQKLCISRRQLYYIIDELKLMGAPIEYNILKKTYQYIKECEVNIDIEIKILDEKEQREIFGGFSYQSAILLHNIHIYL